MLGGAQDLHELGARPSARRRCAIVGSPSSAAFTWPRSASDGDAELAEHGGDNAVLLLEQHGEQVLGLHLRVAAVGREVDGRRRASWDLR